MIACADADMAPPSHYVEASGCWAAANATAAGWEGRPAGGHALAITPGATHYDVFFPVPGPRTRRCLSFLEAPSA